MMEENSKKKILVVDDEVNNQKLFNALLESCGYLVETASNGVEALEKVKEFSPDLMLLDIMMPEMDGYEVCRRLRQDPDEDNFPIVIISTLSDVKSRVKVLNEGANDFLSKPFNREELGARVTNLLKAKEYDDFIVDYNRQLELEVNKKTSALTEAFKKVEHSNVQLKNGYMDTIERLVKVSEYKDQETTDHIRRVGSYCALVTREMGLSEELADLILHSSPLHDIGKVSIPSEILLKTQRLTSEEFALMKTHTTMGATILVDAVSEYLQMAYSIALTHHERWDGSGYPRGLKGEEIPLEGRIMSLADQYDALRSARPYKEGFDHEKTFKIITEGDGRSEPEHIDPKVMGVFKRVHLEFAKIYEEAGNGKG